MLVTAAHLEWARRRHELNVNFAFISLVELFDEMKYSDSDREKLVRGFRGLYEQAGQQGLEGQVRRDMVKDTLSNQGFLRTNNPQVANARFTLMYLGIAFNQERWEAIYPSTPSTTPITTSDAS